jgi:hypothetical protein
MPLFLGNISSSYLSKSKKKASIERNKLCSSELQEINLPFLKISTWIFLMDVKHHKIHVNLSFLATFWPQQLCSLERCGVFFFFFFFWGWSWSNYGDCELKHFLSKNREYSSFYKNAAFANNEPTVLKHHFPIHIMTNEMNSVNLT